MSTTTTPATFDAGQKQIPTPPRTPIRAISSNISTKSTPSLPSPAECYEPLVKAVFRHRLQISLLVSAAYTYAVINAWTLWQAGGIANVGLWGALWLLISPRTVCMTVVAWTVMATPVTLLRKLFLTSQRSSSPSPWCSLTKAFAQRNTRIATVIHLMSSIYVLFLHVLNEYTYSSGDPKLSLFVKSRKHPHYLNGRLLFLVLTQIFTAFFFVCRGALTDRFVYRWGTATSPIKNYTAITIFMALLVSMFHAALAIIGGLVFFGIGRVILPILYGVPFFSIFLRPFTAHFLKGSWTVVLFLYHIKLVIRACFLSFSTFLVWEITDNLFDRVITERIVLSGAMSDSNTTLVSGVTSSDYVFKFFAYSELRDLAKEDSPKASSSRTALFGDQKVLPNLWSCLCRESLLILEKHYQLLLHRGSLPPPSTAPLPDKSKITITPDIGTPTKLLRQSIYKNVKESPGQAALDALASDGPIAQAFDAGADAIHIPELFRSMESRVLASPAAEEATKSAGHVTGLGSRLREGVTSTAASFATLHIPEPVRDRVGYVLEWWNRERLDRKVEASVAFRELDVVIIDVLSYLTCASLTEDRYGVVQKDIPKILETMILFLSAIESYKAEVVANSKPPSPTMSEKERVTLEVLAGEIQKSREHLSFLEDGLKEGIARIVRTFGDKLLAFRFPPPIAQKLQLFLMYAY